MPSPLPTSPTRGAFESGNANSLKIVPGDADSERAAENAGTALV
jgi:hypothetical protein